MATASEKFRGVLLALLAGCFGSYLLHVANAVTKFHELDLVEGQTLAQIVGFLEGNYAHPLQEYPYLAYEFPPVFYFVVAGVNAILGDLMLSGRLISVASALGCAVILATVTRQTVEDASAGRTGALVAAGMIFTWIPFHLFSVFNRVDTLGVLFCTAGLAAGWKAVEDRRWVVPTALLLVLAVFTKQSLIAPSVAVYGVLLLTRPRRFAAGLGASITFGLLILAAMYAAWGAETFRHIFVYPNNRLDWTYGWRKVKPMIAFHPFIPVLLVLYTIGATAFAARAGVGLGSIRQNLRDDRWTRATGLAMLYAFANTLSLYMVFKVGSSFNYFLEGCVALSWLAGLWVAHSPPWFGRVASLGLILHVLVALPLNYINNKRSVFPDSTRDPVFEAVRNVPGPVYSEDLTLLVRAGKQVPWQSFTVAELTVMGTFDETEVVARFRDHYFDRVIIYSRPSYIYDLRHSPAVRRAIEECYASESTIGEYEVLHPRPCS